MNIKQLKKIKGILFDLDGTLVSNDGIQEESILKTFDFFNINIPLKEFSERFTGKGLPQIEKELIKEFNLDIKEGDIREKRKEIVVKLLSEKKSKCTYYAKEIIEFLNSKYPLAICSAGEKEEV
ncbi:HAD family phosphatase, partial [Patescibacteria group bacterium]|nr:HAD family phosphatase [Patescibacteria group bacterium]